MKNRGKERFFTLELESKLNLKNVSLSNGEHENVLIEGTLGELLEARFSEGTVFEIIGSKGVLRTDLEVGEISNGKVRGSKNDRA